MIKGFFSAEQLGQNYVDLKQDLRLGTPTAAFGVSETHKRIIAPVCFGKRIVYITDNAVSAQKASAQITAFTGEEVALITAKDELLLYKDAISKDALFKRINALYQVQNGVRIIVCDIESILQLFPKKINSLTLVIGEDTDFSTLCQTLIKMGYTRSTSVESKGSFALRGDILDIFPINSENPARIDFFGDTVEKIKPYNFITGERLAQLEYLDIVAATDIDISENQIPEIKDVLFSELKNFKNAVAYDRAQTIINDILGKLETSTSFAGASVLFPLLPNAVDFFSFLDDDALFVIDESKLVYDKLEAIYKEHNERHANLSMGGETFSFSKFQLCEKQEFLHEISTKRLLALQTFASKSYFFEPLKIYNFKSSPMGKYLNGFENLISDLKRWYSDNYRVMLYCGNSARAVKMRELISDAYIMPSVLPDKLSNLKGIAVLQSELDHGIILHENKLVIIGTSDLYTKSPITKRIRRKRNDMFTSPEIGDFAVHETHGVGKIVGTKKIETTDGTKEYIALEYRGGDVLYVPVEQMDILSKYMGDENPSLSKIGGAEFERVKQRVKASLKAMAFDLKQLYAERSAKKGFEFSPYTELMEEFENAFEFEETADQISSIQEIKQDMCSSKVMDRLLCGDVGYGKTEVAFRAAYLCILNGKQAALMCPNTILCRQHFENAVKRFSAFGVNVEVLNRFKTPAEQDKILAKLSNGEIDLIIGTHRLLSKDVKFKDLGLLVLDEEQRFGVEHKEKIKNMKNDVDCLTMTATPIPRTLHMSLSGIRDISTIETPPTTRLPVQTYVVEETETLIRDAVLRELARGGQVFILYNRVETIFTFAAKIKEIIPEAKVTVAHGRMDKSVLENGIMQFYGGKYNVLISTTIIENGIDLPKANTLVVIDSDRLGISQLYQLRGRVGRGSLLAHAYFTFKPEKVMTERAGERLKAIMEFTELGSGFKIAMRDLEIRGAGNVLGREQHGHMDKVGYELYAKLLKEELTGVEQTVAELDIKADAFIPEKYIEVSASRLDCYKQIAEIRSVADYKRVCLSIEENYGKMPKEVLNLMIIAVLKAYASKLNVRKISVSSLGGEIVLPNVKLLADEKLKIALDAYSDRVSLDMTKEPALIFKKEKDAQKLMLAMTKFLKMATGIEQ